MELVNTWKSPSDFDKRVELSKLSAEKLYEDKNLHLGNSQISALLEGKLLAECKCVIRHQRIFMVGRQTGNPSFISSSGRS